MSNGLVLRVAALSAALTAVVGFAPAARAWDQFHASAAKEAPECVSWTAERVDCLARSSSGRLSWSYSLDGKWSTPRDLGGALAGPPSCVVRGPRGINCFVVSAKGMLATIALNGAAWGKWGSLGGQLLPSRASCVGLGRDRISCFARGRRGELVQRTWSGGKTWDAWRNLGGALTTDPECIVAGGARAACFGRSSSGELVAFLPDTSGRSGGWTTLGARIEGKPSCVRLRSGESACVAQGLSGRLQIWRGMAGYGAGAGIATSSDDVTVDEPGCALQGRALVCFTRTAQRQLVRRTVGAGADTSRDGILASPAVAAVQCLSLGNDGLGCVVADASGRLHFASGQALEAGTIAEPSTAADEEAGGAWFLTNLHTGAMCRAHLSGEGAKRLRLGPRCRLLGLPGSPSQWDQAESTLLFLDGDGQAVLRFHSTQTGRWISPRRAEAFLLSREPPEGLNETSTPSPPPSTDDGVGGAPDMAMEMAGPWRVFADGRGFVCTLQLTEEPERKGLAALFDDACRAVFPPVAYWMDSGPAMLFVGPDVSVVARFDAIESGRWRAESLGGLTLTR